MYIRPVRENDLDRLLEFVIQASTALTTLPPRKELLADKISESIASEDCAISAGWKRLMLVLYDPGRHCIVGVSGLEREKSCSPHYTLDSDKRVLRLDNSPVSPLKLGSLLLHKHYRNRGYGALLSLSRFLYLASFANRLGGYIHAELRGWTDTHGRSPFWSEVGSSFYGGTFSVIDQLRGTDPEIMLSNHIGAHEIPLKLIDHSVQRFIGSVHPDAENALRMLQLEGFSRTSCIDLLDGGPIVKALLPNIHTIRKSVTCPVEVASPRDRLPGKWMISNGRVRDFRSCLHPARFLAGSLQVHPQTLAALLIEPGDKIRGIPKEINSSEITS